MNKPMNYLLAVFLVSNLALSLFIISLTARSEDNTVKARQVNAQRQQDLQNYIKCLSLLRFDYPELGPTSTRTQVEIALDKCADKN